MDDIIDRMRTQEAIAGWTAADAILTLWHGDVELATLATQHMVGSGLTKPEAELIIHHIHTLAKER
jgi:hypothetical protein